MRCCARADGGCYPIDAPEPAEVWGGLYASGHLECHEPTMVVADVVDALCSALADSGYTPLVNQNQAGAREFAIWGQGVRIALASHAPLYSIHMDADLGKDAVGARQRFDALVGLAQTRMMAACAARGVHVTNLRDLDFTYTDSKSALSVVRSSAAEAMTDPLVNAIRDWHRERER